MTSARYEQNLILLEFGIKNENTGYLVLSGTQNPPVSRIFLYAQPKFYVSQFLPQPFLVVKNPVSTGKNKPLNDNTHILVHFTVKSRIVKKETTSTKYQRGRASWKRLLRK